MWSQRTGWDRAEGGDESGDFGEVGRIASCGTPEWGVESADLVIDNN